MAFAADIAQLDSLLDLAAGALSGVAKAVYGAGKALAKLGMDAIQTGMELETAAQGYDTLADKLEGLERKSDALAAAFYGSVAGGLHAAADAASGYLDRLQEAFDQGGLSALAGELGPVLADAAQAVGEAAPAMAEGAVAVIQAFVGGLRDNLPAIAAGAAELLSALCTGLFQALPELVDLGIQAVAALVQGVNEALPGLVPLAMEALGALTNGLLENLGPLTQAGVDLLSALADGLIRSLPELLVQAPVLTAQLAAALIEAGAAIVGSGEALARSLMDTLMNTDWSQVGSGIIQSIAEGFLLLLQSLGETFGLSELSAALEEALQGGMEFLQSLPELVAGVWQAILSLGQSFWEWFDQLPGRIGEAIGRLLGHIHNFGLALQEFVLITVPQAINAIAEWFGSLPGRIAEWLANALAEVALWAANLIRTASEEIPKFISKVVEFFSELPGRIMEIGADLVRGLWEGIKSMAEWIKEKVGDFFGGLLSGFQDAAEIHSPSRLMAREVGRPLAQGIGLGFAAEAARLGARMISTVEAEAGRLTARFAGDPGDGQTFTNHNDNSLVVNVYPSSGDSPGDIGRQIGRATQLEMRRRGLVPG